MRNKRFQREDPRADVIYNGRIKYDQVRVTTDNNESSVMSKKEAMSLAQNEQKDLILINEKADPPVCKIMELNKFLYEQKQRKKEAAKRARESKIETKEIRMSLNIGQNDIDVKCKQITKMLEKKNCKVTITVTLKGRERGKQDLARDLLSSIAEQLEVELEPFRGSHNRISATIK